MTTPFKIVLVAAVGENGVIGYKGQLPWRLKSDLRHFRHVTINRPLVMGRKTYDSIGKPLDHRTNIVLSRDLSQPAPGTVRATTLEAALGFARDDARKRHTNEIMVIGGGDLFEMLMPRAARLEIT
ncbi:MAG: dihydrofolate reductase, partial [Pseudolabrys sp.]